MKRGWIIILLLLGCEKFYFKPPSGDRLPPPPEHVSGKLLVSAVVGGDYGILEVDVQSGEGRGVVDLVGANDVQPVPLDGSVLFASNPSGDFGLFIYGEDTSVLYDPPGDQLWPSVSPSGRYVAFSSDGDLALYDRLESSVQTWHTTDPVLYPTFIDDGHIMAVKGGALWIFSLDSLIWAPVPGTEGAYSPSLSPDGGRLAYVEVEDSFRLVILTYPSLSKKKVLIALGDSIRGIAWAPGGDYLAFGFEGGLYVADTAGNLYLLKDSLRGIWVGAWVR